MPLEADTASPVATEPPFVQPHHFSDIDVWKVPDRNFYVFIALSFIFGFFGLDHFYLRSFGTALQKFLFNIITLGMWYVWDIVQIVSDSKKVRNEGLTSPFDWIRGIGRGVFLDPLKFGKEGEKVPKSKKEIVIYAMLTLMFGLFGMDKFYLGEPWQGFAKFFANFNLFFFFGWMWVIWDIVNVFFYPENMMKEGISAPPLFNMWFSKKISAEDLFIPKEGFTGEAAWPFLDLGLKSKLYPESGAAVPILPFNVDTSKMPELEALKLLKLPTPPPFPNLSFGSDASGSVATNSVETNSDASGSKPNISGMTGGGLKKEDTISYGPIIAGTLTAITMAGSAKILSDMVSVL
jgi:TM2 domain-containing membrane protein YozV